MTEKIQDADSGESLLMRLYKRNENKVKLGLDAMRQALIFGELYPDYPHLLVAGTNGKGQTCALLSTYLTLCGRKTGLFTSPHLMHFAERIRIDGQVVSENLLNEALESVLRDFGERPASGTELSFFELSLAAALRCFREVSCDFGVFEVGLGGRLDATNVLSPILSVITTISFDHTEILGDTAEKIAYEKSGILREGCPAVIGSEHASGYLKRRAAEKGCPVRVYGEDFSYVVEGGVYYFVSGETKIAIEDGEKLAHFQRHNLCVAVQAALLLKEKLDLPDAHHEHLSQICKYTRWQGRMSFVPEDLCAKLGFETIILDAAHNVEGASALADAISSSGDLSKRKICLIVAACADKDIERMVKIYRKMADVNDIYVVGVPGNERLCSPQQYCMRSSLPQERGFASLTDALHAASRVSDCAIITGSVYLLGDFLRSFSGGADMSTTLT